MFKPCIPGIGPCIASEAQKALTIGAYGRERRKLWRRPTSLVLEDLDNIASAGQVTAPDRRLTHAEYRRIPRGIDVPTRTNSNGSRKTGILRPLSRPVSALRLRVFSYESKKPTPSFQDAGQ